MTAYEILDLERGDVLGLRETRAQALADIASHVEENGGADRIGLAVIDEDGLVVEGPFAASELFA